MGRAVGAAIGADGDLADFVDSKRLLILMDNFEQIVEAAPMVSSLLAETPNAKVLVTSREPLHVDSEQRYAVEPLPETDATILFVERAQAVDAGFAPQPAVTEICRRLDGLPLAIELAAARVAMLDPDELLERLEERLPLLTSRSHSAPERQRTLSATIEWSYQLLSDEEQSLFRRLAAFRGSFSVEAAEAVCGCDLDLLESLVLKSLVRRWGSGRLGMLDTIREFAIAAVEESTEADVVQRAHAEYFLRIAEDLNMNARSFDARKPVRFDVAMVEQDNFRAALAWAAAGGDVTLGLRIATGLEQFWTLSTPRRACVGTSASSGRPEPRTCRSRLGPTACARTGARPTSRASRRRPDAGTRKASRSTRSSETSTGAPSCSTGSPSTRCGAEISRRRASSSARAMRSTSGTGDKWGLTQTVGTMGAIERDAGNPERARELIAESAALANEVGHAWWESGMLAELAQLDLAAGRLEAGREAALKSLAMKDEMRDRAGRVFGVGLLARAAAEAGDYERAGLLWGAIEDEDAGAPLGGWRRHRQENEERIRSLPAPSSSPRAPEGAS